jgi:hypothetical protein
MPDSGKRRNRFKTVNKMPILTPMGKPKTYRWERRRARREGVMDWRVYGEYWAFAFILLILIFAYWLIGARLLLVFAMTQSHCAEMLADFGSGKNFIPAFQILFWICVLIALYWLAITARYWRVIRRSKSALFHFALLGAIVVLSLHFIVIRSPYNIPPDGTLTIRPTIMDMTSGTPEYFTREEPFDIYGDWHLGPINSQEGTDIYRGERFAQQCVWLDRDLILDNHVSRIDGYGAMFSLERKEYFYNKGLPRRHVIWPRMSNIDVWKGVFSKPSMAELTRQTQYYRPLLPEERERFLVKQACMKSRVYSLTQRADCEYTWRYNVSKFKKHGVEN